MIQSGQREGQFFPFGDNISFVFAFPFAEINTQILAPAGPFVAIFWTIYHCGKSLGWSKGGADLPILGLVDISSSSHSWACTFFTAFWYPLDTLFYSRSRLVKGVLCALKNVLLPVAYIDGVEEIVNLTNF